MAPIPRSGARDSTCSKQERCPHPAPPPSHMREAAQPPGGQSGRRLRSKSFPGSTLLGRLVELLEERLKIYRPNEGRYDDQAPAWLNDSVFRCDDLTLRGIGKPDIWNSRLDIVG